MSRRALGWLLTSALVFGSLPGGAHSAELKILTSRAVATVLAEIGPEFENKTGYKLNVITGLSAEFVKRINAGETFDVIAAPPPALDALIKSGKIADGTKTYLVRSATGVEVRAGAPHPDISSVDAFKRALLAAKSITYLPVPGVPQLVEQLGLKDDLLTKVKVPDTDICSELVANGEVELGIVLITQILTTPGVELVGPLPPEIQFYSSFSGAVAAHSTAPEAARDLLLFLKGPAALRVIKAQGMEPI